MTREYSRLCLIRSQTINFSHFMLVALPIRFLCPSKLLMKFKLPLLYATSREVISKLLINATYTAHFGRKPLGQNLYCGLSFCVFLSHSLSLSSNRWIIEFVEKTLFRTRGLCFLLWHFLAFLLLASAVWIVERPWQRALFSCIPSNLRISTCMKRSKAVFTKRQLLRYVGTSECKIG